MAAINQAYATVQEYKAVVGNSDSAADILIARHLLTCSRLFDREVGQWFGKSDAPVSRIFKAKWTDRLDLDVDEDGCPGIADMTGFAIKVDTDDDGSFADESAWSAGDFELLPRNAQLGPESRPYTRIETSRSSSKRFVPGNRVQVTAIWGWPAVPDAVRDEIIELCGIWRTENPRATGRMNELDAVVSASPMAMSLLKRVREAYSSKVTF